MVSIYRRKDRDGKPCGWRAVVRIKGHPSVCNQFERKQEAEDWALSVERQVRQGQFKFERHKVQRTFSELVDHFVQSGALEHHRSAKDTVRHLEYWKTRIGDYALVHLTCERLGKERQLLIDTPTHKNTKRSSATVNRYIASLSASLTYACRQLRWIDDNPCFNLIKLKEAPGRDRVLNEDETVRLLEICRKSRCTYLYCIVLMAFTTGMRQGEILGLTWNQIDFENQMAHLKETKNGTPRSVHLIDAVVQELKVLFENRNPAKSFVFASKTAFGALDINKPWKEALKQADIENFVFHSIRHHFATLAARSGASNLQLKAALGHKTLQMLERYTHLDVQTTRLLSQQVSQKILGDSNGQ
jgi:integrase